MSTTLTTKFLPFFLKEKDIMEPDGHTTHVSNKYI